MVRWSPCGRPVVAGGVLLAGILAGCFHGGDLPYATCEVAAECHVAVSPGYGCVRVDDDAGYCAPRCQKDSECPQDDGAEATPTCVAIDGADDGERVCALVCAVDADCAAGMACREAKVAGGVASLCLPA